MKWQLHARNINKTRSIEIGIEMCFALDHIAYAPAKRSCRLSMLIDVELKVESFADMLYK